LCVCVAVLQDNLQAILKDVEAEFYIDLRHLQFSLIN
jgi:hypothetical protein